MKNDDFQYLFSYPFERTLPHKPLEHHQCQSLDMLCKLECERKSIILFASQQQLITAKFWDVSTLNINNTTSILHCQIFLLEKIFA